MAGRDLIGIAQTGTGKTAAFALPILHYLATLRRTAPRDGCRVLILSPTRELASQIAESFRRLGAGLPLSIGAGGKLPAKEVCSDLDCRASNAG